MALTSAGLDPLKPQVLHPRLAFPNLIRCQTSLNSLIYGANFGNYVRVTDSYGIAASGQAKSADLQLFKHNVLSTFPQCQPAQFGQIFSPLYNGQEVVAGQLPHLAGEAGVAVGQKDLRFTESSRIQNDVTPGRVAGVVFKIYADFKITHGNPDRFTTPTAMNDLVLER